MKFNGMDEIMNKNANHPYLSICVRLIYVAPPSINSLLSNYIPFDIRYLPPFYRTWSFIQRQAYSSLQVFHFCSIGKTKA